MTHSEIVQTLRDISVQIPEGKETLLPVPIYHNAIECEKDEDRPFEYYDMCFLIRFIADMME